MLHITKEIKIALTAICTVVILFFGIKYLKGINLFQATNYYYVAFDNAGGITQSSPVYANGFHIGIVRRIAYDYQSTSRVVVEIEVDKAFKLPKGSHSELVTEMLGTTKMHLMLNQESQEFHTPGDTIPGRVNGGLMDEAARLVPTIAQMLPKLDSITTSLNTLLADPALRETLHNAAEVTANLNATTRQLKQLTSHELPQIAGNLCTVSENFATISTNLQGVDYAATLQKADTILGNFQLITDKLNRRDNTMGLLLNDPSVYQNLDATTHAAAAFLRDLKSHPKRYVHFSLFGKKDR